MGLFAKRNATIKNYNEFRMVFNAIKKLNRYSTTQELDMAAGFLFGIAEEKETSGKITKDQKNTLTDLIESVWREQRKELEYEDELENEEYEGNIIGIPLE